MMMKKRKKKMNRNLKRKWTHEKREKKEKAFLELLAVKFPKFPL